MALGTIDAPAERRPSSFSRAYWPWRFAILVLLAGYLLFAHGCHGDEDNELFASGSATSRARQVAAAP